MLKAVIFDLDNTLIDFMRMKRMSVDAALNAMLGEGLRLEKEEASRILYEIYWKHGIEHQEIFQKFLSQVAGHVDYKLLAAAIVAYRRAQAGVLEPYAMVVPTLLRLREQGLKLAIISDAPRLKAWIRLVEMKIHDFFDVVVTFDDTGKYKPSREPFEAALRQLRLRPQECIMVGDWPEKDMKGASAMGMKTAFAKYGATRETAGPSIADYELKGIEDILAVVARTRRTRAKAR